MKMNIEKLYGYHIEVLDFHHGKEVAQFYMSLGLNVSELFFRNSREAKRDDRFYGFSVDGFFYYREKYKQKVITLEQARQMVEEKKYPRVMYVSNNDSDESYIKRVVFMEKNGRFISWAYVETLEEAEKMNDTASWHLAKEIEEESTIELTLEQIAEKFGKDVKDIKIVK